MSSTVTNASGRLWRWRARPRVGGVGWCIPRPLPLARVKVCLWGAVEQCRRPPLGGRCAPGCFLTLLLSALLFCSLPARVCGLNPDKAEVYWPSSGSCIWRSLNNHSIKNELESKKQDGVEGPCFWCPAGDEVWGNWIMDEDIFLDTVESLQSLS